MIELALAAALGALMQWLVSRLVAALGDAVKIKAAAVTGAASKSAEARIDAADALAMAGEALRAARAAENKVDQVMIAQGMSPEAWTHRG